MFELISVFLGNSLAFARSQWNENQNIHRAEYITPAEISNSLKKDLSDVEENILEHEIGIKTYDRSRYYVRGADTVTGDTLLYCIRDVEFPRPGETAYRNIR